MEVHISNIHARDELHRHSRLSAAATAVICNLGPYARVVWYQKPLVGDNADLWIPCMEIELNPDSVHKKVVDIPHDELPLSKRYSMGGSDPSRGGCR